MSVMLLIITVVTTIPVYGATAHNYYKGVPAQGAAMADNVAKSIAISIMGNPAYVTDLQKVQAAASIVACQNALVCNNLNVRISMNQGVWYFLCFPFNINCCADFFA